MKNFLWMPMIVFIGLTYGACSTTSQMISNSTKIVKSDKSNDDDQLGHLLSLKETCGKVKPKDKPEECKRDFQRDINKLKNKYATKQNPNICVIPLSKYKDGLMPEYKKELTGYSTDYYSSSVNTTANYQYKKTGRYALCARVYNFGNKTIKAIKLKGELFDGFSKVMTQYDMQKNLAVKPLDPDVKYKVTWFHGMIYLIPLIYPSADLLPRDQHVICSKDYQNVSLSNLDSVRFKVEKVKEE